MIKKIENIDTKIKISSYILNDLSNWFGLAESTKEYIEKSSKMDFWTYYINNSPVGFIALKETSTSTAEIYVMGILKKYHKQGIGKKLFNEFFNFAKNKNYDFIQVKTVAKGFYKEYDATNVFYKRLGFKELEVFPTLWDNWNPCQVLIMAIN
ncbi:MAG: GNAT family N-acetyltransferase [Miniphocaeibacter sp.]|uniref:GNAT family N-acetyltransferase n=1 Tax=Miniphocaeibacter sp. TaxID=3100973 RepID=UPI00180B7FFF|nr:GNAT family N-acetyltransferase [Gallicola sp.]